MLGISGARSSRFSRARLGRGERAAAHSHRTNWMDDFYPRAIRATAGPCCRIREGLEKQGWRSAQILRSTILEHL